MAAVSKSSIWAATSGGAVRYDTASGKTTVATNLDGLSSTDLAGIIALGDTLWATSVGGDLNRLLPDAKIWESFGSYRLTGWTFRPRVLATHKSLLFLGGDQGLSVFSTSEKLALDNINSFGDLMNQKVHAVLVEKDTLWVGLQGGAAYAVPTDWQNIGRGKNILSDPSKWTVIRKTSSPVVGFFRWGKNDRMRTVPDTATTVFDTLKVQAYDTVETRFDTTITSDTLYPGTDSVEIFTMWSIDTTYRLDSSLVLADPLEIDTIKALEYTNWPWATSNGGNATICTGGDLYWNGKSWQVGGTPLHAVPYSGGMAVSVEGKGLVLLRADGSLKTPNQPPQLPEKAPHHLGLKSDGSLVAWFGSNIYSLPDARSGWSKNLLSAGPTKPGFFLPHLEFDFAGNSIIGTWGSGLWRQSGSGWTHLDRSNSCLQSYKSDSASNVVIPSAISAPTSHGNWIGLYGTEGNPNTNLAFLPLGNEPRCFQPFIPSSNVKGHEPFVNALASEGDTALWIAHKGGIERFSLRADSLVATNPLHISVINPTWIRWHDGRLLATIEGNVVSLAKVDGVFRLFSPTSSTFQNRGYRQIEVDTLGNLWVSGSKGLDIISIANDSTFSLEQRLDHSAGLLSDDISHFSLNRSTGAVAIATPLGVNLYQSRLKIQPENLQREQVRPFPNPYRKLQHSKVAFPGVNSNAELFIFAADGTLVNHQSGKDVVGDQFLWTPRSNLRPGLYFWTISDGSSRVQGRLVVGD
ncbi:MAG: hypothetical protein RL318_1143 [Fibrobacterota bacterium]